VVGIGVNVNTEYSELPVALRRTATSLKMVTGASTDRSDLLSHLLLSLERHYADAVNKGFEGALQAVRSRDYLLKRAVSVQTHEGVVTGQASGIDERGALLVEMGQRQIRRFHSGDVSLQR
jgi:BirA family biotin operon repressor/biotin-[acetyl-CoA-carboxylase] ligase